MVILAAMNFHGRYQKHSSSDVNFSEIFDFANLSVGEPQWSCQISALKVDCTHSGALIAGQLAFCCKCVKKNSCSPSKTFQLTGETWGGLTIDI